MPRLANPWVATRKWWLAESPGRSDGNVNEVCMLGVYIDAAVFTVMAWPVRNSSPAAVVVNSMYCTVPLALE